MDKELNVARVLKQLVYILEENDFVLYYDKRFESLKPQIDDEHDYLYNEYLNEKYHPVTYLRFRDSESKTDYNLDYRDSFTHTLHYSKYHYPMPQNPFSLKMETYLDPYKTYSEVETKELAEKIYNELMSLKPILFDQNTDRSTKYRTFITLTKEPPTKETLAERIYGHFELHDNLVQVKIIQYQCWDSSGFAIQLNDTTKIKASTTMDDIGIKIEDSRELKVDEHFTENVQTMIDNVKSYIVKDYCE